MTELPKDVSGVVANLRYRADYENTEVAPPKRDTIFATAVDIIEAQAEEIKRLREALKPFAVAAEQVLPDVPDLKDTHGWTFQAIDFRRARTALNGG